MTKRGKGLPGDVLALLTDAGRGVTLGQIQQHLPVYHHLSDLSPVMVRLEKRGVVSVALVERTADKGRRMVKQYSRAAVPAADRDIT
ncbi:hypothetical protein [Vogesella sp. AC12]|uniref:hypothetical protein n=1 Tax=Vogesella sp. AC12 TaxID=2950550 RepID=UPI002109DE48|nr:hypothetical protein [Vogesella sp. AC12]MCQ4145635.1 hypothetical protein [Vogesella sp. AC12]